MKGIQVGGDKAAVHQRDLVVALDVDVIELHDQPVPLRPGGRLRQLLIYLIVLGVAGAGDVAA